jgi:hypothetical protein
MYVFVSMEMQELIDNIFMSISSFKLHIDF